MNKTVAIVTGGSSGIGYSIAQKLCCQGIITYIIGRNEEKVKTACCDLGENAQGKVFDLNNLQQIPALIEEIFKETGKIDILVNNAGINMKKDFLDVTDEEFTKILNTNVNSIFSISREVARKMKIAEKGSIINISSMAAQYGIPKVIAYTASKTAIEGMTRAMAVELAPLGIRVNCIAPGFIKTPMSAKALDSDEERKGKVLSRTPMNRLGEPDDIAEAAFFLGSESSKYTTGVILPIDGGNSIGF